MLAKADGWEFDSFALDEVTQGRPLSSLAFALFKRMDLVSTFDLDEKKLAR